MLRTITTVVLAVALALPVPAVADDYFKEAPSSTAVAYRTPRARTANQRFAIWGLLGGAGISAGIAAWAHLESRAATREVELQAIDPQETWTADRQATYDRAHTMRGIAIVGYVLAAGFLAGATVVAYRTRPGYETVVIEPARGGATVSRTWTW